MFHLKGTVVRYSPDGSKFCTVGSDMKAFVYDTASLSKVGELKGHKGTINACAWSADGSKIVTVSADKTAMVCQCVRASPRCRRRRDMWLSVM